MRGCAELSWHTAANYIQVLMSKLTYKKLNREGKAFPVQRFAAFMFQSRAMCAPNSGCCSIIYITLAIKRYISLLMFGLSLILAAKQTLGLNLRVFVMLACSGPTLEMRARVMRLERLTKTNL